MVQFAPLYRVELWDASIDLRAQFDDSEKYNLPGPGAAFQQVTYKLKVSSPSSDEAIQSLIQHAERGCHTAQSLRESVSVSIQAEITHP